MSDPGWGLKHEEAVRKEAEEHKTIGCIRESCRHELEQAKTKSQTYFSNLAAEMRRPHFGEQFREIYRALLLRAQEAGLYSPEET